MKGFKYSIKSYLSLIFFAMQSQIFFAQPLSGTYTIGGSNPDFITIMDAVNSLQSNGISSKVTFNIRSGVYETSNGSERVMHISQQITGASGSIIVIFQADTASGASAENTILRRTNGVNEAGWVAYVRSSNIALINLTFQYAHNDTNITGVNFNCDNLQFSALNTQSTIDNISVLNCSITTLSTSVPRWGFSITRGGNNIVIENSFVERCGDGIYIERCNGCQPFNNITIKNNVLRRLRAYQDPQISYHGTAIFVSNGSDINISGNDIDYETASTGLQGIHAIGSNIVIGENRIRNVAYQNFPYDSFTAIVLRATSGNSLVRNNMISNIRKRAVGINLQNSNDVYVYNNSVVLEMVNASNLKLTAMYISSSNNINVKNNILATHFNTGSFNDNYILESGGTNSNISFDYNLLYSEPFKITFDNTTYDSLQAWQQTGQDINSKSFEPEFLDLSPFKDIHLGYCSLGDANLWGTPVQEVYLDFDGEVRDPLHPYIGADEVDSFRPDVFSDIQLTSVEDEALFFAAGDIDDDGDDDIAVVNNYNWLSGSEDISIFWNDGQGNFSAPVHLSMGVEPTILKIKDIDGDGYTDLIATTNSSSGAPVVRWGLGNGNFSDTVNLPTPPAPLGAVSDFDFVAVGSNERVWHLLQTHYGIVGVDSGWISYCFFDHNTRTFSYSDHPVLQPQRAGMHPHGIVAVNINNDTDIDFIVNDWTTGKTSVFLNLGLSPTNSWLGYGLHQQIPVYTGTNPIHANLDVGDIDGDSDEDIVIGAWANGVDSLVWLKNNGNGMFSLDFIAMDPRRPSLTFSILDYEGDNDPDIISATTSNDMILYRNDGIGNFDILRLCQNSNYGFEAGSILTGDFNGNGRPDVAVLTYDDKIGTMLNLNYTVNVDDDPRISGTIPDNFILFQNYPNPFNPTTTIQYSIPQTSNVKLKVYDVLGNEVETLINQEKNNGVYSVNFDASGLSSGVYFYRLQAGSFNQVKKMILLR